MALTVRMHACELWVDQLAEPQVQGLCALVVMWHVTFSQAKLATLLLPFSEPMPLHGFHAAPACPAILIYVSAER